MKMLLIGDPNSPWIINFICSYLKPHNMQVTLFTDQTLQERNIEFYQYSDIEVIECSHKSLLRDKHTKLGYWINLLYHGIRQKGFEKYDIINIQYVDLTLLTWAVLNARFPQKIIISYWGSDLFRKKEFWLKRVAPFINKIGKYTFDNIDLYDRFMRLYGERLKDKCQIALFGLPLLEIIKEKQTEFERCDIRHKFDIDDSKTVIAIGYNGKREQQHMQVLREIKQLDEKMKRNIIIILQMTYGGDKAYRDIIKDAARKTGCKVQVFEDYLEDDEVAEIRCIADIYINSQTTDAFSGSVCEYLYSGACLLNAKWLRYAEFDRYPFQFWEYEKFSDLAGIIREIIEKGAGRNCDVNRQLVWKLRSWECCEKVWNSVFCG